MITLRNSCQADESFIYATWLRSQYYGNTWFKQIDKNIFFNNYKRVVSDYLITAHVQIACLDSDPDVVVGYAVYSADGKILRWVYVKRAWRRLGIAKKLVDPDVKQVSSLTRIGRMLMPKEWIFNPFS